MIAPIDLTDQELAELKELTREDDVTAAVRTAMMEYLRHARRMKLKELSGCVLMEDNWSDLESAEGKSGGEAGAD